MCCGDGEEPDDPPSCHNEPGQRRLQVRLTTFSVHSNYSLITHPIQQVMA